MQIQRLNKLFTVILLTIALLTACTTLPPADPKHSGKLHEEAIRMTALKNYPDAIAKYEEAISYNPKNSTLYRHQAEVLEANQQFTEASRTYQLALDRLSENHPDLEKIHYRLGLLQARNKSKHRKAKQNLAFVTEKWMRLDLEGMILLHGKTPGDSLKLFNQALSAAENSDQQARIYYHASLAHYALKDIIESKNTLFHAVNNARSLALKQHIRIFFEQIR